MTKTEANVAAEHAHPGSGAKYVYALIVLLCLTALSLGLHYVAVGELGTVVALTIAAVKVAVVAIVFMELGDAMAATRAVAAVAVVFVVLLCLGVFADVGFR